MTFTACILKPRGPLHLGEREGVREGSSATVRADTLFAALCHALQLLYGRVELERFLADHERAPGPPLLLSSTFPWWQDEYYFPVPRHCLPTDKDLKHVRFVARAELARLLAGAELSDVARERRIPRWTGTEWQLPWRETGVPRVTLSRATNHPDEGGFYEIGLVHYAPDAGLFFLVDFRSGEWEPRVRAALNLMAEEGIGGYRTVGRGSFERPRYETLALDVPEGADAWLSLSTYYPADVELDGLSDGFYDLLTRSGYVFSPECRNLRRKTVRMFGEGAVFPGPERRGRLVDVTPDTLTSHRVYRSGLALGVPCRLGARGGT